MSEGYQRDRAGNGHAGEVRNACPAVMLSMWGPFLSGAVQANAAAQQVFGAIAGEWQAFVNHRFQEDLSLIQRLSHSATADQVVTAHSEFWQKAAEDYRKEFATVTKLLTKAAREASAASQRATGDCSAHALLAHQAA